MSRACQTFLSNSYHETIVATFSLLAEKLQPPSPSSDGAPPSALLVGMGGGSLAMFLYEHFRTLRVCAVELDAAVVRACASEQAGGGLLAALYCMRRRRRRQRCAGSRQAAARSWDACVTDTVTVTVTVTVSVTVGYTLTGSVHPTPRAALEREVLTALTVCVQCAYSDSTVCVCVRSV